MTALLHEWGPDPNEPAICVHCTALKGEEGVPGEECPRRLRVALDAARGLRWEQHQNNRSVYHLIATVGRQQFTLGSIQACIDPGIGHCHVVRAGAWVETAKFRGSKDAADCVCRHLGIDPVPL